jgi:hypothetical protein
MSGDDPKQQRQRPGDNENDRNAMKKSTAQ